MKNIIIVIVAIVGVVFPSLFIIANAVDRTDKTVACMQKEIGKVCLEVIDDYRAYNNKHFGKSVFYC